MLLTIFLILTFKELTIIIVTKFIDFNFDKLVMLKLGVGINFILIKDSSLHFKPCLLN